MVAAQLKKEGRKKGASLQRFICFVFIFFLFSSPAHGPIAEIRLVELGFLGNKPKIGWPFPQNLLMATKKKVLAVNLINSSHTRLSAKRRRRCLHKGVMKHSSAGNWMRMGWESVDRCGRGREIFDDSRLLIPYEVPALVPWRPNGMPTGHSGFGDLP